MKLTAFAAFAAFALSAPATAASFSSDFGTTAATWASGLDAPPTHFFAFTGDHVSQQFSGTGLTSVSSLALSAPYFGDTAGPLTFTFSINGSDVGNWILAAGTGPRTDSLNYSFGSINAVAGSYTIGLRVTAPICSFCGSYILNENSPLQFTLASATVPEPASWALLIGGFAMTGVAMRRRKALLAA